MKFKYTLILSGRNFDPDLLLTHITESFLIASLFHQGDLMRNGVRRYDSGILSIWAPNKFSMEETLDKYENWYVDFIERNFSFFNDANVEDISLFIEVYRIKDEQCNFEIFSKTKLMRLSQYSISIPVSIYDLSEDKMNQLT
jgi:hypothetical protein